jgi:hypothetical protein
MTRNGRKPVNDVETTLANVAGILRGQVKRASRPDAGLNDRIDAPTLAAFADVVDAADQALTDAVAYLRSQDYSWGDIAAGLGLSSRQAAQQRFERRGVN